MLTDTLLNDEKELVNKVPDWIIEMDSAADKVMKTGGEYREARRYFEHDQAPSDVPADKDYVEENLVTDLVFRLMGQLIGGKFTPFITGGGVVASPLRELFMDILDENKFTTRLVKEIAAYFYVEGLVGIKVDFNPFKKSVYGLGFPEIIVIDPYSVRLDNNSVDLFHNDDMKRAHKISIPLDYARRKFPAYKDDIEASQHERRTEGNEYFCDLHEMQLKYTTFEKDEVLDKRIEVDKFYIMKIINGTVPVKEDKQENFLVPSRFSRFTLNHISHTPRIDSYKYPFAVAHRMKSMQDQLNTLDSVILEAAKASIKMPVAFFGVTAEEGEMARDQITRPDGVAFFKSPGAKMQQVIANPLVRPLIEQKQMTRHAIDEITGRFSPDRGEISGDLSGKAISLLQYKGIDPEFVSKSNIEDGLSEVGLLLLECMVKKMQYPFMIEREVEGAVRQIFYNTPARDTQIAPDEYNLLDDSGYINMLNGMGINGMRLKVKVDMNLMQKQEFEMNKAIMMRNGGNLSLEDFLKAMEPDTWREKKENLLAENQGLQMLELIKQVPMEAQETIMNQLQQFIKMTNNKTQ